MLGAKQSTLSFLALEFTIDLNHHNEVHDTNTELYSNMF